MSQSWDWRVEFLVPGRRHKVVQYAYSTDKPPSVPKRAAWWTVDRRPPFGGRAGDGEWRRVRSSGDGQ